MREQKDGGATPQEWLARSVAPKLNLAAKSSRTFFEHALSQAGATFATWTALATLKVEGPMIQRALAQYLSIEGPTLSRHLESLESRGLIVRSRDGSDRRTAVVELTEEGERTFLRLEAVAQASNEAMLKDLSAEELQQLHALLDKIVRNVAQR